MLEIKIRARMDTEEVNDYPLSGFVARIWSRQAEEVERIIGLNLVEKFFMRLQKFG